MNRKLRRHHILSAVMVTTLAAATGCASTGRHADTPGAAKAEPAQPIAQSSPTPSSAPPTSAARAPAAASANGNANVNVPSITNGSSTVIIAGQPTRFGSTVTDGVWSPDGSRLAYVDDNGNIATARPDGSDVRVLTRTDRKVKRAHPTWGNAGSAIEFTERGRDSVWRLITVPSNESGPEQVDWLGNGQSKADTAPNAVGLPAKTPADVALGRMALDRLAYQHAGKKGPEIWILDGNQREPSAVKVAAGGQPALTPNGQRVAFVGRGGQLFVETITNHTGGTAVQITFGVRGLSSPAWSPDGTRIAFRTSTDVESVSAKPKSTTTNPVRVESKTPGVPSYRPAVATRAYRLATSDPIVAAVTVSRSQWANAQQQTGAPEQYASEVTLIDTDDPGAAVTASEADLYAGPVLFVHGSTLDSRVRAEISRVILPSNGTTVTLVGNVSARISAAVAAMGYAVARTSKPYVLTPDALTGSPSVLVVSQRDRAAVADYAVVARATNSPVLFVYGPTLTSAQRAAFNAMAHGAHGTPTAYVFGSDAAKAVSGSWSGRPSVKVVDLTSADPTVASLNSLWSYSNGPTAVALVSSTSWQMQMVAVESGAPVLLVDPNRGLSQAATMWLTTSAGSITSVYAFGDAASVSTNTLAAAAATVSGPAGAVSAAFPTVR
jgi:WD40-like Beta Propeller Repeat